MWMRSGAPSHGVASCKQFPTIFNFRELLAQGRHSNKDPQAVERQHARRRALHARPPPLPSAQSKGGFRAASASPPCVMRRPNGRCSLSGLVWPSPDSGLHISQFQTQHGFQQRQLLGETLVTTPFRAPGTGFFGAETEARNWPSTPSGERETRRTHWKSPPLVGIFGASPHVGRKRECVVGATGIEPVIR